MSIISQLKIKIKIKTVSTKVAPIYTHQQRTTERNKLPL